MRKIFQYIMLAVVTIVMASCTSDIEETTATTGKSNVQLVVGEFPAFGDSQTRTIGTPAKAKLPTVPRQVTNVVYGGYNRLEQLFNPSLVKCFSVLIQNGEREISLGVKKRMLPFQKLSSSVLGVPPPISCTISVKDIVAVGLFSKNTLKKIVSVVFIKLSFTRRNLCH